jgi:hypothetical protein
MAVILHNSACFVMEMPVESFWFLVPSTMNGILKVQAQT